MSTDTYEDFREAIRLGAFVRGGAETKIIQSEHSGEEAQWLFDFRALMLQAKWLNRYAEIFWQQYASHYPFQVGAMETAGIGLVAAIVLKSVERGTPINGFFMRKSRKRQGLMKQIEGTLTADPIVLVDDLINTGGTFDKQILILREAEKEVSDIFAILAFRERAAYARFEEAGIRVRTLFTAADFSLPFVHSEHRAETKSPELVWRFKAPGASFHLVVHKSTPALDKNHVFFGTDDGTFYAIDQASGEMIWKYTIGGHPKGKGILSSPAVHDGTVYFGAYDGTVYALDAETGIVRWKYEDADWVGSSPALWPTKNLLYIGLEYGLFKKRGGIAALDMQTGKEIWRKVHPALTHGSPLCIPEESLVVIGSNASTLYAYDALTGEEKWRTRSDGDIKMAPAYDAIRRLVVFTSMDAKLYAVGAEDGIPVWARETGGSIYAAPCVASDIAYAASLDKTIYAIDLRTGKDVWTYTTNGRIFASPTIADGSLWIGSNDGKLYELDPLRGKLKSIFQASERVITKIARNADDGRIFFATVANELYCIQRQ